MYISPASYCSRASRTRMFYLYRFVEDTYYTTLTIVLGISKIERSATVLGIFSYKKKIRLDITQSSFFD